MHAIIYFHKIMKLNLKRKRIVPVHTKRLKFKVCGLGDNQRVFQNCASHTQAKASAAHSQVSPNPLIKNQL